MIRALVILLLFATPAAAQHAVIIELVGGQRIGMIVMPDGTTLNLTGITYIHLQPDTPPIPPISNPYPEPSAQLRQAVKPIVDLTIPHSDAKEFAAVHQMAADGIRNGVLKTTAQLRTHMIERGKPLGLRDKYPILFQTTEKIAQEAMGLQMRDTTEQDAAVMLAIAWAAIEAAR